MLVDDVEYDDIRFDVLRRNVDGGDLLQQAGQFFGMVMVGLEPGDMPIQRINSGGGQDARLAHRAAVHTAKAACSIHEPLVIGDQQRSNGSSQSFRETERDGFEVLCVHSWRQGGGGDGIEEPGSVEVHGDAMPYGESSDFFDRGEGIDGATSGIVRVFDADEGGRNAVRVVRPDGSFHLLGSHDPTFTGHPMELDTGQCSRQLPVHSERHGFYFQRSLPVPVACETGLPVDWPWCRKGRRARTACRAWLPPSLEGD